MTLVLQAGCPARSICPHPGVSPPPSLPRAQPLLPSSGPNRVAAPQAPPCPAASQSALTIWCCDCHADCLANQKGVPLEEVQSWTPYPGGAPANVVAALGRLKVNVSFLTAIGEDDLGRQMIELLESELSLFWCQRGAPCCASVLT